MMVTLIQVTSLPPDRLDECNINLVIFAQLS
jgi:hypothetical protein